MGITNIILPKVIYEGSSEFNDDIKVIKYGSTVKLIVNGIVQSFNGSSRYAGNKVWGQTAKIVINNKENIKSMLLLGMGGGTMLHILEKEFDDLRITAVEIDPIIIELGKKYFETDSLKKTTIINEDAINIINDPVKYGLDAVFDCLIIDTYIGGIFPEGLQEKDMISKLVALANTNGLLVFNKIIYKNDTDTFHRFKLELETKLRNVNFKRIKYPSIADNYVFFGFKI